MNNNGYYTPNMGNQGMNGMPNITSGTVPITNSNYGDDLPLEQSYIENILRLNKGKVASFYMTYPGSQEWNDRIFTGVVEQAARDHFVVSDPKNGKWYLLPSIYLDFIVFDEEINYKVI